MKKRLAAVPSQFFLVLWTVIVTVPFVLISLLAFRPQRDIFAYPLGIGGSFTLDNFAAAWNGPIGGVGLASYFGNSATIAVAALVTNLVAGSPAAYFATKLPRRARTWFVRLFLIATVIPLVLLVVPYYQLFDSIGFVSSPVILGVAYGVIAMPTTVLVLHAFFSEFPVELIEASELDGLGMMGSFLRVVLPLSRGAIVAVSLLALVFVWGESQLGIALLQDPETQSVPVGLLGFRGQFAIQLGPIFAGLALATVPIIVVYLIFNRFISKGIALGGVFR